MVSVIIPIYNAEDHLQRCLDTLLVQTYSDFEVIMVDDGSVDESGEICNQMAIRDDRFRVFHQKNGGVSSARNTALKNAKGEFVTFVDADDYVDRDYIKELMCGMQYHEVDICYCNAQDEDDKGNSIPVGGSEENIIFYKSEYEWNGPIAHPLVRNTLFRKELIRGIYFNPYISLGEDSLFFAQCLIRARRIYFSHNKSYHYVIYGDTASHGPFDKNKLSELTAWRMIAELYEDDKNYDQVVTAYIIRLIGFCRKYYDDAEFKEKYLDDVIRQYREYKGRYLSSLRKQRKWKSCLNALLFDMCPLLYLRIRHE